MGPKNGCRDRQVVTIERWSLAVVIKRAKKIYPTIISYSFFVGLRIVEAFSLQYTYIKNIFSEKNEIKMLHLRQPT